LLLIIYPFSPMTKIAINGFGRIGRLAVRSIIKNNIPLEVVAINDLTDNETLAHLFEFDSTMGRFDGDVSYDEESISINGKKIAAFSKKNPAELPWKELGVDIVLECTGVFRNKEKCQPHLDAGAKRVLLSAPGKGEVDGTFVIGVNEQDYDPAKHVVISNASCTTNCLAPVAKVLDENFNIVKGLMTTIHSFTNDQCVLDAPHADLRRARTASDSMIPTTTGAAKAVGLVLPQLKGKLNGFAVRVPTPDVSIVDLTVELEKAPDAETINAAFLQASQGELNGILGYETKPLVSIDYRGENHSSVVDAASTMAIGNMAKIVAWYDNEWGYATRLVELAKIVGDKE
jgi:glyceraldehyde 3-phosphate dehydrogenase